MTTEQLKYESPELGDAAFRMIRALARRAGDGDLEGMEQLARLELLLVEQTAAAAAGLHERGYSWAEIGQVNGTTRQNAYQRWHNATTLPAHPHKCQCGRDTCPRKVKP